MKSFTLIEVLIAIIVFGVGVLAISSTLLNNLDLVDKISAKQKSYNLAREGLELMYNKRDSNLKRGISWNCAYFTGGKCRNYFSTGKYYNIYSSLTGAYELSYHNDNTFTGNKLYYNTGNRNGLNISLLNHNSSGEESDYARYISFEKFYLKPLSGYGDTDNILKIKSNVKFKRGNNIKHIKLESSIGDI